ncbi:hypothetical protein HNQ02_000718 [Flavobacterium sp. 7E]|uniref:GNAT family N-acetyltransferase n=1 Tax=Flavobacterium sp. 7E TaxID=2735898 RepID=UPI0015701D91|nr:GNAT family N-acetyltransferase [Flavobacterium sp. 7E]NRS87811.1 hypothetical protein [Flavobacterium sp. 7E]
MSEIKIKLGSNNKGFIHLYEDGAHAGEMIIGVDGTILSVYHTEVEEQFVGKGYAKILLDALEKYAIENKYKIKPLCPYVHAQFQRSPTRFEPIWQKE